MKIDSLEKLYVHELKDLWSAEKQVLEILPRLSEAADDEDLTNALNGQIGTTRHQIERLERVFEDLDFEPRGHRCAGMEGLIREVKELLGSDVADDVADAAIVSGLQRAQHDQIAAYGAARSFAEKLGRYHDADALQDALNEESLADQRLTRLAERNLNFEALAKAF